MNVNKQAFDKIVEREKSAAALLPEHTLDWYTFQNRITLLKEVESLFSPEGVKVPTVEAPKKPNTKKINE